MNTDMRDQQEYVTERRNSYPLCKDCAYVVWFATDPTAYCQREHDLINGDPVDCKYMRSMQGGCQVRGYLFIRREDKGQQPQ